LAEILRFWPDLGQNWPISKTAHNLDNFQDFEVWFFAIIFFFIVESIFTTESKFKTESKFTVATTESKLKNCAGYTETSVCSMVICMKLVYVLSKPLHIK
jgi:hypothetical protein